MTRNTTILKPIKKVMVKDTLAALEIGQSTMIPFAEASSATISTTASRLPGKTFRVETAGRNRDTLITRLS